MQGPHCQSGLRWFRGVRRGASRQVRCAFGHRRTPWNAPERRSLATTAAPFCDPERWSVGEVDAAVRSEEHTSELQSRQYLVCRLLLEKNKHTSPSYSVPRCISLLCASVLPTVC